MSASNKKVSLAVFAARVGVLTLSLTDTTFGDGESERRAIREEDFQSLFNGRDLCGWNGHTTGYKVINGNLVCTNSGRNIFTGEEYADFILRFDFRLTAGANNGIGLRSPAGSKQVSTDGIEIQILDDTDKQYRNLKPYQFHGSIYGVVPAKRGALKPTGEWNQQEIRCEGPHVEIKVNGRTVVDAALDEFPVDPAPDGHPRPGIKRTSGHIALLGHSSTVEFRNLRIMSISREKSQ